MWPGYTSTTTHFLNMLMTLFYIPASIILFYFGASYLLKGASSLALKTGISPFVTGLTVVAFGLSTPALLTNINLSITGFGSMALGNVIGSNLFNICIIAGIAAIIGPVKIRSLIIRYATIFLAASTLLFMILFSDRQISTTEGFLLLSGFVLYIILMFVSDRRVNISGMTEEFSENFGSLVHKWYRSAGSIVAGSVMLAAGAWFISRGAHSLAAVLGVGPVTMGLTVVAVCTGIPLLAVAIAATIRKQHDIMLGTMIGSCICNILAVAGISALVRPLSALAISQIDLFFLLGITLLLTPFVKSSYILKRDEGIFMAGLYLIYIYYLWPK